MRSTTTAVGRVIASWIRRGAGRAGRSTAVLTAAALCAATLVVLLTLSVSVGLADRTDRSRWMVPQRSSRPVATQVTTTRYLDGRPVRVVHLAPSAAAGHGSVLPVPPGTDHFPSPGEILLSPALEATARRSPAALAGVLGDHHARRPTGVLGRRALGGPDELVAVIGHDAGDPMMDGTALRDLMRPDDQHGPVGIEDFSGVPADDNTELVQYRSLALIAAVLLVVPALSLAAAGARLGASRRAERLAKLRLAGLGRGSLVRVTLLDALPAAAVGAAAAIVLHVASLPLASRIALVGTRWYAADLLLPGWLYAAVLMATLAVVAVSALVPLRRILSDPIAVADQHSTPLPGWWRLAAIVVAALLFLQATHAGGAQIGVVVALLGVLFLTLNLVGPLVLGLAGRWMVRRAGNGARLVAARRILDDPKGAWRQVSSVALAAFIAGFLALFSVGNGTVWRGDAHTLHVAVAADHATADAAALGRALADAGVASPVTVTSNGGALDTVVAEGADVAYLAVPLDGDRSRQDTLRRVVATTLPAAPQATGADVIGRDDRFGRDFRSATIVILATAFALASVGTAITATAAVIDRRRTNQRLHRAGVPFGLLDRSRRIAVGAPALISTVGGAATGLLAASPITVGSAGVDASGVLLLALTVAVGVGAMRLGVQASRPLLRRTTVA